MVVATAGAVGAQYAPAEAAYTWMTYIAGITFLASAAVSGIGLVTAIAPAGRAPSRTEAAWAPVTGRDGPAGPTPGAVPDRARAPRRLPDPVVRGGTPSQPNYLALFSGSTHGVTGDKCPERFHADNLAAQLRAAGDSYASYAESLPSTGFTSCTAPHYDRAIAPWTDFTSVPAGTQRRFSAFPRDDATLPTVSFVLPNVCHNMHYGHRPPDR